MRYSWKMKLCYVKSHIRKEKIAKGVSRGRKKLSNYHRGKLGEKIKTRNN